jgi:hypothetical protein
MFLFFCPFMLTTHSLRLMLIFFGLILKNQILVLFPVLFGLAFIFFLSTYAS